MRNYHQKKKTHADPPLTKHPLVLKGKATSKMICSTLRDLNSLARPNCKQLTRKNDILPFEEAISVEFLAGKNNCSMFAFGNHSKKRPNNLTLVI